jgi:hypothetical protein
MIIKNISELDITGKNLFIIGKPATGKTYLSNILHKKFNKHEIIHTDEFIREGFLFGTIQNILFKGNNYIIEGQKILSIIKFLNKSFLPDIILEVLRSDIEIKHTYKKERDISKYEMAIGFYEFRKTKFDTFISEFKNIKSYSFKNSF